MKKVFFIFCFLLLSCQGPWEYYPEDTSAYKGIWTDAYIIADRPIENICFDKLHALDEVRMPGFAFYESALVEITGSFHGQEITVKLEPTFNNPNCFEEDSLRYLGYASKLPEAGKNYELNATFTWDSSGQMVTSNYTAKTYIPKKFEIKKAYDMSNDSFEDNSTIKYLKPTNKIQSIYFVPEYSDDVGGALVSMILYNTYLTYWGEDYLDYVIQKSLSSVVDEDMQLARHARFGNREILTVATAQQYANMKKEIDSIQIEAMNLPAHGYVELLFYGTTPEYIKYRQSFLQGGDSRTKPIYNIENGAGIFTGMVLNVFRVNLVPAPDVKLYPYDEAQEMYCRYPENERTLECMLYYPDYSVVVCESMEWCKLKDFPIYEYPACGTEMVRYSKLPNVKSPILDREVKKWCSWNPEDKECKSIANQHRQ